MHHHRGTPFLGLSPDGEAPDQKGYGVYHLPGKTREKGKHHRSRKKGIRHRASDPEKEKEEGFHGGGVYFFSSLEVRCLQLAGFSFGYVILANDELAAIHRPQATINITAINSY